MKDKPIKWGFKWWCSVLYEFDLYFGKKQKTELWLGEIVVLNLSKKLENAHCILYFDNFFNSPTLVQELFDSGIYCLGTVRSYRKHISVCKEYCNMKRGDLDFQYAYNVVAVKWFDNRVFL